MAVRIFFSLLFFLTIPSLFAGPFVSKNVERMFLGHFVDSKVMPLPSFFYDFPDLQDSTVNERFIAIFLSIFQQMNTSEPFRVRVQAPVTALVAYYDFYVEYFDTALRVDFIDHGVLYHALISDQKLYLSTIENNWIESKAMLNHSCFPWNDLFPALDFGKWNHDQVRLLQPKRGLLPQDIRAKSR